MHVLTLLCCCADPGEANVTKLATKFSSTAATTQRVRINPVQFHFHTRSEHVLDGEPGAAGSQQLAILIAVTAKTVCQLQGMGVAGP
jgi:hypothetical protein